MALRWTTAAFDAASKGFRRIMGHEHLWMLKATLDEPAKDRSLIQQAAVGQSRISSWGRRVFQLALGHHLGSDPRSAGHYIKECSVH
jgi:hypothetical protein